MPEAISVLIVDDHAVVRQGLRTFLELQADMEVVGEAPDGEAALECVERLVPDEPHIRIPHIGWNEVNFKKDSLLHYKLDDGKDFYFVHSYHFVPTDPADVLATTPYCGHFVSAIQKGSAVGVQFHPEKSQRAGLQLIRNFLAM